MTGQQAPVNTSCVFPFTYNGAQYYSCTTIDSPNGQPWCATSPSYGNGAWGYCNCGGPGGKCVTAGSMAPDTSPCHFPFIFNGISHYTCLPGLGQSWCATAGSYADGAWGFCNCFNFSYTATGCIPAANASQIQTSGPTGAVHLALMLLSTIAKCAAPIVETLYIGPYPQGYSYDIVVFLNYSSLYNDVSDFVITSQPQYGILDTSMLSQGIVKYRITNSGQYFYGNDTFTYIAQQTGLTTTGLLSPCSPLQSKPKDIIIDISNLHDAPALLINIFEQPTDYLSNVYQNNSNARFIFDIILSENEPFSITLNIQVWYG